MIKRLNSKSIYNVTTERGEYKVILTPLKNTTSGQPRFEAIVIVMRVGEETGGFYNAVYRFGGHYLGEAGEAEWIVNEYEKGLKVD